MMKSTPLIVFLLLVPGCVVQEQEVKADSAIIQNPLIGTWELVDLPVGAKPCSQASIEYLADGRILARSGEQILEGHYVVKVQGSGYLVSQPMTSHNDKPNCQGYSGDFVMKHNAPEVYMEVEGDKARLYFTTGPSETFARLVRTQAESEAHQ